MLWVFSHSFGNTDSIVELRPIHYRYTVEDGLNSNFITDLFNDSKGTLWIGTQNGMNVFDGKVFKSIDFEDVSESFVTKTTQSPDGTIWFNTLDGSIYSIDGLTAVPHPMNDTIREMNRVNNIPLTLTIDSNHTIYSGGNKTILKIDFNQAEIVDKTIRIDKRKGSLDTTTFDTYNKILMGISNVVYKGQNRQRFQQVNFNDVQHIFQLKSSEKIQSSQYYGNSSSSFAISNLTYLCIFMNNRIDTINIHSLVSNSIYFENDTTLWVGTQSNGAYQIVNHELKQVLLPEEKVHAVVKDFEDGFWFGTETGLYYYPNLSTSMYHINGQNQDFLEIGQYENRLVGIISPFTLFKGNQTHSIQLDEKYSSNGIKNITSPRKSYAFLKHNFTTSTHYYEIDWDILQASKRENSSKYIYTHHTDTFTYSYGQLFYRSNNKPIEILYSDSAEVKRVIEIMPVEGKPNRYVVTHFYGALILEIKQGSYQIINSFKSVRPLKNLFYLGNSLFVTSQDDYIYHLNFKDSTLNKVGSIPREDTRMVYQLTDRKVLLGTAAGLKLLSIKKEQDFQSIQLRNITGESGLIPLQVDAIEVLNDTIYTLCKSGIIQYPIDLLEPKERVKGNININQLLINGHVISPGEKIFNDQTIAFNVTTVSFKDGDRYSPQFRLLPINEIGQALNYGQLNFYNLPANNYTLQIQDQYGQLVQYRFSVHDYFYQKWWFIVLVILALTGFIFIPFYIRNKFKVAEAKLEAEKDNWRLKTLTSQLKPHFIFNALSSIQAFILKNDTRTSSEFLSKFSMHIRNALEQTRTDNFTLHKALDAAKTYLELEQLRLGNHLSFEIKTNNIPTEQYIIPVMLLQPYIENAVIHGVSAIDYPGKILIEIKQEREGELTIQICDNGKGLKNSSVKGHGIGTSVNQERLGLINARKQETFDVQILNNPSGNGVCVIIKIIQHHG